MHALLFELNSIQSYLFSSGKLRDMVGASELLDQLTNGSSEGNLLDAVLDAAEMKERIQFSRRAGGAFYAFSEDAEAIADLRRLWTLAVQQTAPGLSYSIAEGEGADHARAFAAARDNLRRDASRIKAAFPVPAPVAHRVPRTGRVAVALQKSREEWLDAPTRCFKAYANPAKAGFLRRFSPEEAGLRWQDWPLDMEGEGDQPFPFKGDDHAIALIHADGNGLGQLLMTLRKAVQKEGKDFIETYSRLSRLIEQGTQAAARAATTEVLVRYHNGDQCLPARPLLLGGDDITVLVRADLALEYIEVFSRVFEEETAQLLAGMAIDGLPDKLTLGFGVVFMRASQPFHMGIELCEQLMAEGKKRAKVIDESTPPATLVFHRVTGSLVNDYQQIIQTEFTHHAGEQSYCDTLGVYTLDDRAVLPRLDDLKALAQLLDHQDMARGPTRQLLTLMGHSLGDAQRRYKRWRQLMKENKNKKTLLEQFDRHMNALAGEMLGDLPYSIDKRKSPLGDALALLGAGAIEQTPAPTEEKAE